MFLFLLTGGELSGLTFLLENLGFVRKYRIQEFRKMIGPSEAVRPTEPACSDGANCQNDQRSRHRFRGFVDVVFDLVTHSRAAVKGQEHQAKHVERPHKGSDESNEPEQTIGSAFR